MSPQLPQWPAEGCGLDDTLDIEGVQAQTGCTAADFEELSAVFREEEPNMTGRLQKALAALQGAATPETLAQAADALRTAAHELATSFAIVGARRAEAFARHTQVLIKQAALGAAEPPSQPDLVQACRTLMAGVLRASALLETQTS